MRKLEKRAGEVARVQQQRAVAKIAARMRERLGGARVEEEQGRVTLSGPGMLRRWLADPALRFAAGDWR